MPSVRTIGAVQFRECPWGRQPSAINCCKLLEPTHNQLQRNCALAGAHSAPAGTEAHCRLSVMRPGGGRGSQRAWPANH
eukprot:3243327-Alexandrium_andersonii.AAC.1